MQELTLVIGILALGLSGYAVFMLTKLVQSLDTLSNSVDRASSQLDGIARKVESQQTDIAALQKHLAEPQPQGIGELVPFILQKGGNAQWGTLISVGVKLFAAYWKKRQGNPERKTKSLSNSSATASERNASSAIIVQEDSRAVAHKG